MTKMALMRIATAGAAIMAAIALAAPASAAPNPHPPVRAAALSNCLGQPFTTHPNESFTQGNTTYVGRGYAGHYSGLTAVPSKTQVTSSGVEAQCLLARYGDYNPGGIDGVFGSNSQRAMKAFQTDMNDIFGAGLSEDGMPGPQSWKWLRFWEQ
jgi:hypothetical protein